MLDSREAARLFKLVSSETRVRMLRTLSTRCLCVGALARSLGISAPAASQHLRVLSQAGLVRPEKRGYHVHYQVDAGALARLAAMANELAGMPNPDASHPNFPLEATMCDANSCCQKPENLETKPEECSPEQIRKCHGDVRDHPCKPDEKEK
ncbi:ArsR/SmtB family transcription factor [Desulfohalovibrio reitneri]|uniref:ArsR/SmtB family transcription factor n=1 Tax=Desulfohalovibrio reitneri TaxID=1307759 RepID=UPI000A488559|nr:metalloregulator ArsR/SmtB family transcription factor [Desulfohalovibrio reitneri]